MIIVVSGGASQCFWLYPRGGRVDAVAEEASGIAVLAPPLKVSVSTGMTPPNNINNRRVLGE